MGGGHDLLGEERVSLTPTEHVSHEGGGRLAVDEGRDESPDVLVRQRREGERLHPPHMTVDPSQSSVRSPAVSSSRRLVMTSAAPSGIPRTRYVNRSSVPSSAQCRSSTASTVRRCAPSAPNRSRMAAKSRVRSAAESDEPAVSSARAGIRAVTCGRTYGAHRDKARSSTGRRSG